MCVWLCLAHWVWLTRRSWEVRVGVYVSVWHSVYKIKCKLALQLQKTVSHTFVWVFARSEAGQVHAWGWLCAAVKLSHNATFILVSLPSNWAKLSTKSDSGDTVRRSSQRTLYFEGTQLSSRQKVVHNHQQFANIYFNAHYSNTYLFLIHFI